MNGYIKDNIKWSNIHLSGVPEGEKGERIGEKQNLIRVENFPKESKNIIFQIQEALQTSKRKPTKPKTFH